MDRPLSDTVRPASDRTSAAEAQSFVRHELRAPLAVIQPTLGMLLDGMAGPLEQRQLGYLSMLERNVARLSAMITSVVESGWLEVAAIPSVPGPVDVGDLVRTVAQEARASRESAVRLEVHVAEGLPCVRGDAFRLGRALRNVVRNACSYTTPGGRVGVRAEVAAGKGHVVVDVEDSGCGIGPDDLPHVFELGYRGEAARTSATQGLGLGLPVARAIILEHGGEIMLDSTVGQGTRVLLELPPESPAAGPRRR